MKTTLNPKQFAQKLINIFLLFSLVLSLLITHSQIEQVFAQVVVLPAQINKSFTPISIVPGEISTLEIEVFNPNFYELTAMSFADNLSLVQEGIYIADDPNIQNTCNGTVTAVAGETTISLSGGSMEAATNDEFGSCYVRVDVTSITQGNLINRIPVDALSATGDEGVSVSNSSPVEETLLVLDVDDPSVVKSFSPNTVWVGQNSVLTIEITNQDNAVTLTEVSLIDNLPSGLTLSNPVNSSTTDCGSPSLSASPGGTSVSISGAEIAPGETCEIQVNVSSSVDATYHNEIPIGDLETGEGVQTRQGVTNGSPAAADLNVQAVGLEKAFSPTSILAGETSTLTITIQNPTGTDYTGTNLTDVLPGSVLEVVDASASTTCTLDGSPSNDPGLIATTLPRTVALTGGTVPAGDVVTPGECTITVTVQAPTSATEADHDNVILANALVTDQGITNISQVEATLSTSPLTIDVEKAFSPDQIYGGNQTTMTFTLTNESSNGYTGVNFTDDISVITGATFVTTGPVTNYSEGCKYPNYSSPDVNITAQADGVLNVALVGIPPAGENDGQCIISVPVNVDVSAVGSTYTNTIPIGEIGSDQGVSNLEAGSDELEVYQAGFGMDTAKSFNPAVISPEQNTYVQILLWAPEDQTLTEVSMLDTLPDGVLITNSTTANLNRCGSGTLEADTGTNTIQLTGASIEAGNRCRIRVWVTSDTAGSYANVLVADDIDNDQSEKPADDATATLRVSDLTTSKSFYPGTVNQGGSSTLTISLQNTNDSPLVSVSLSDNLNTMGGTNVVIADTPNASTTCPGGSITAVAGTQTISMSGASIPAEVSGIPGICTLRVDVTATGNQTTRTNTLDLDDVSGTIQGTSTVLNPREDAEADLVIQDLSLDVVKGFKPSAVFGGSSSTMSIELINPNGVALTGISLVDNMPGDMRIANPPNFDVGVCGGEITGTSGQSSFTFSGGYLPAGARCVLRLSATMEVMGNLTNTIRAGDVNSFNGASNDQPSATTLTNLPGVSVVKYFDPPSILGEPGAYSTLTIEIENRTNIALSGMGVIDDLPGTLPAGLYIAESPAPAPGTDCGGSLTAATNSQHIELEEGALTGYQTCTIEVPVTSTVAGEYVNIIPKGAIVTNEEATNKEETSDTLTVLASPEMQISKDVTSSGPYSEGGTITYDITVYNRGDISLHNVVVTDPGANVTLGSCTPANGSDLASGTSMVCTASHIVSSSDVGADMFGNTAYGDSDETEQVWDSEEVRISSGPAISIDKITTSNAPYELGDTITYQITVNNIGTDTLNNVQVSEPSGEIVMGTCTPALGSSLAPGISMICPATHVVTQNDIDAGSYSNTAYGDSDETVQVSDTVEVPIYQNPKLSVYKEVITDGPYELNDVITYQINALNSGNQNLYMVGVTDPDATIGTCTPSNPVSMLSPGDYITCSATYQVTQTDIDNGSFTNTATANSNETEPTEGSTTITFERNPAIEVTKTGTLNMDVVPENDIANVGDTITYEFEICNTGNVTLTNVSLDDTVDGVDITNTTIPSLAVSACDSTTFTGTYTITQDDLNANTFTNTATVTGSYPGDNEVTDSDTDTQIFVEDPHLGMAKRVVGDPLEVSAGTWDVTYEIMLQNYGNVTLDELQITDDLSSVFASPTQLVEVRSLTSSDFTVNWPGYNGSGSNNLLASGNSLDVDESGTLQFVVRVIPADSGPFENSATASGDSPGDETTTDISQNGAFSDPDNDGDPNNNSEPTPVDFGPNLFDPPSGVKLLDANGLPVLNWTMIWINDTNIVAINAEASDEIPFGSTFIDDGISSGYALPQGQLPAGTTNTGVVCDNNGSSSTVTRHCYYEGPTSTYLRGRIVWVGELGPDLGATTHQQAVNDIHISFNVSVDFGVDSVHNQATIDADLNGDGDVEDAGEQIVAEAEESWESADELPKTGFAPGRITLLPQQNPKSTYADAGLQLAIPSQDLLLNIVTVPMQDGNWDVTWLGENAGYLIGSAYPTWEGNTVITAHNWSAFNQPGPFSDLRKLHYGDQIRIHAFGMTYTYEVRENKLVAAHKEEAVFQHSEYDVLTLLTCELYNPFSDDYLFRRMVRAVLVDVH